MLWWNVSVSLGAIITTTALFLWNRNRQKQREIKDKEEIKFKDEPSRELLPQNDDDSGIQEEHDDDVIPSPKDQTPRQEDFKDKTEDKSQAIDKSSNNGHNVPVHLIKLTENGKSYTNPAFDTPKEEQIKKTPTPSPSSAAIRRVSTKKRQAPSHPDVVVRQPSHHQQQCSTPNHHLTVDDPHHRRNLSEMSFSFPYSEDETPLSELVFKELDASTNHQNEFAEFANAESSEKPPVINEEDEPQMSPVVLSPEQKDTSLIGEILQALSPEKSMTSSSVVTSSREPDTGETPSRGGTLTKKDSNTSSDGIPFIDDSILTPGLKREFRFDGKPDVAGVTLTDGSSLVLEQTNEAEQRVVTPPPEVEEETVEVEYDVVCDEEHRLADSSPPPPDFQPPPPTVVAPTSDDSSPVLLKGEKPPLPTVPPPVRRGKAPKPKSTEWHDRLKEELAADNQAFEDVDDVNDDDDVTDDVSDVIDEMESDGDEFTDSFSDYTDDSIDDNMKGDVIPMTSSISNDSAYRSKLLHPRPLVIDNGSYTLRAGWSGEFVPESYTRNVIGHWRNEMSEAWREEYGNSFYGDDAIAKHSTMTLEYPMQDGIVSNWSAMKNIWDFIVEKNLETEMTSHPVIISESTCTTKKQREKMMEVLMETYRVPGAFIQNQSTLASISSDKSVSIVVNCGHSSTEIVPIYEGYQLTHATKTLPIGGRHITEQLSRLIQREQGFTFSSVPEVEFVNSIKESKAWVNDDCERGHLVVEAEEVRLPDGQMLTLASELVDCTEILFKPSLVGSSSPGLHQLIKESIELLDPEFLSATNNTLLLVGGGSRLDGLQERLQLQLDTMELTNNIDVRTTSSGSNATWIGGSLYSDQSDFLDRCIDESRYLEYGAAAVHRYCY